MVASVFPDLVRHGADRNHWTVLNQSRVELRISTGGCANLPRLAQGDGSA